MVYQTLHSVLFHCKIFRWQISHMKSHDDHIFNLPTANIIFHYRPLSNILPTILARHFVQHIGTLTRSPGDCDNPTLISRNKMARRGAGETGAKRARDGSDASARRACRG